MKRYKITTPEPGHTEVIGMIGFVQGVAECDADPDAAALKYFRAQGYGLSVLGEGGEWVPEPAPNAEAAKAERIAALEAELAALRPADDNETPAVPAKPAKATKAAAKSEEKPE